MTIWWAFLRCSTSSASADYTATGYTRLGVPFAVDAPADDSSAPTADRCPPHHQNRPPTRSYSPAPAAGHAGVLLLLRGVDTANPVSGYANTGANYYSHGAVPWTTTIGSLILAAAANEVVSPNASAPTVDPDYTQVANQPHTTGTGVTRTVVWVGSKVADTTTAPASDGTVWASASSRAYWAISLQGT